ncbi:SRPBCC family protein [Hyphomonas sp.]|uniref:SRPBCC family protein n=1 Tax=Hyphomonas sp. TaxID=87 RepID=UPI00391DBE56
MTDPIANRERAGATGRLSARVETIASAPLETVWKVFVPVELPRVFPRRKGPIPAVTSTSGQTGRWDVPGQTRFVHLSDGTTVREEITFSEPSEGRPPTDGRAEFGYRVSGFTGPMAGLAAEARGAWLFEEIDADRTRIIWTYVFVPASALASLPLGLIVRTFWTAYMRSGLANIQAMSEAA